jgi:hypothetical protein
MSTMVGGVGAPKPADSDAQAAADAVSKHTLSAPSLFVVLQSHCALAYTALLVHARVYMSC